MNYYDLADITQATLFNDRKNKIVNLDANRLRSYPMTNRLLRKNVVREQGGLDYRWLVDVSSPGKATSFSAWHTKNRTQTDSMKKASMQLRGSTTDFSFDALEEDFNAGQFEIVNIVRNRRQNAMIDMTKKIERDAWSNADVDDDETPQGMMYWLPYASGDGGFVGTVPSGYTLVAGLNPSTYTAWKSWGGAYVAVTQGDLILKMRNAWVDTDFMSPINPMLIMDGVSHDWAIYVNKPTLFEFEDQARDQNDNLGPDVSSMNGRAMFSRTPLEEVPTLNTTLQSFSTRSPVIGINWGAMENRVRKDWWMKVEKVAQDADQPFTVSYDLYCYYQPVMLDRRTGGFNIAKAA